MKLSTTALSRVAQGRLVGSDVTIDGATIDSRDLEDGQLFVPIIDERDGHDFIAKAVEGGASAYFTSHEPDDRIPATAIVVEDTRAALTSAGRLARDRLTEDSVREVVGITGSVGKTSVKDLTKAACGLYRTSASVRSFNNELGVPLTLLNAPDATEVMIVEMGARGLGHIRDLCAVALPTIGVVTMVGAAHTEAFGGIETVARAKGELIEALPSAGKAILNAEIPAVADMAARTDATVITFGSGGDVRAERVEIEPDLTARYRLVSDWGKAEVHLPVCGIHNVTNSLAAAAVALVCAVPVMTVAEGLAKAELSPWRMDVETAPSGAIIVNDSYNANPMSMRAALESLAALAARRRIAVVGQMAELGTEAVPAHLTVCALAGDLGIRLIAVDCPSYAGADVVHVHDHDAALGELGELGEGDAVLLKGSRVAGLERLAERLLV